MKTIQKLLAVLVLINFLSCDNDDGNAPNENVCNYQGLTADINGTVTLIPESDLYTDYLTAGSNGPEIEIYDVNNPGDFNFTTTIVNETATGSGTIVLNGTAYNNVSVTCQRGVTGSTGALVGDEFRFDVVDLNNNIEVEFCVIVDELTLGYIDADGDGCGSQTISYSFGVLNNLDLDDSDPNVCF